MKSWPKMAHADRDLKHPSCRWVFQKETVSAWFVSDRDIREVGAKMAKFLAESIRRAHFRVH